MKPSAWLSEWIRLVVFGNIWVAFGAASMYGCTTRLHNLPFSPLLFISIFGATLFFYNYHRLFRKEVIYALQVSDRHQWIIDNHRKLQVFALVGLLMGIGGIYPFLTLSFLARFSPFILLAVFYVIPVWKENGHWFRLRDLPYIKIFLVSAVWAFVTVFLPFMTQSNTWLPDTSVWLTTIQRFVFIFAITLPFDIRDLEHDRKNQVKTFASLWGIPKLKLISRSLLVLTTVLGFVSFQLGFYSISHSVALLINCASTGYLISQADEGLDEWFYAGWLDGAMLDQFFWILLLGSLF